MDPILAELAKTGITTATKFLLEKVLNSAWNAGSSNGKDIINQLTCEPYYTEFLSKHVSRVIKIRTIHSPESDIFLNEIYHPLSINESEEVLDDGSVIKIKDGFNLENNEISNIIGFAGQGKSTILRKLFIEQIKVGSKVPFFIELRKTEKIGIKKQIEKILTDCGIKTSEENIHNLLSSGRIILMLDGFDEVSSSLEKDILNEIVSINNLHATQIITTSRPNTAICNESHIKNYKVRNLNRSDIIAILKKLNTRKAIDNDFLPSLLKTLEKNENVIAVMNLPILVALFYVCYPYLDSVPNSAVDFYSSLFTTLYLRHDKVKNFDREKSSSLGHKDAFDCFNALCFKSLNDNALDFNEMSLTRYVESAMRIKAKISDRTSPEALADDFINITCLIQKDGYDRYVFLHKSVQEYHAAEFIKNLSIDKKKHFYRAISIDLKGSGKFNQLVKFLLEIDNENTLDLILMPLCKEFDIDKWDNPTDDHVEFVYQNIIELPQTNLVRRLDPEAKTTSVRFAGITVPNTYYSWINLFYLGLGPINALDDVFINVLFSEKVKDMLNDPQINKLPVIDEAHEYGTSSLDIPISIIITTFKLESELKSQLYERMKEINKSLYQDNLLKIKQEDETLKDLFDFLS